ncbi:MAG: hypothetical protein QOK05_1387 [Chloroflexota bacterium]|nr:hypothetical protein [Chloroflexota bacterium]
MTAPPVYDPAVFWEEILSSKYSLVGVGHGGYGERYNRWLYRAKLRAYREALEAARLDPAGRSVLDVGIGTGVFVDLYSRAGATVSGVDITQTAVDRQADRHPEASFWCADLTEGLGVEPAAFDIVHCLDVLYHVTDEARFGRALDNLGAACRPGGHVVINDCFSSHPLIPRFDNAVVPHVVFRPGSAYTAWIEKWGLRMVADVPMYFLFNRPIVGATFPWTNARLSWQLRHRLFALDPLLRAMWALDGPLRRWPWNSSLRVRVYQRPG